MSFYSYKSSYGFDSFLIKIFQLKVFFPDSLNFALTTSSGSMLRKKGNLKTGSQKELYFYHFKANSI